MRRCKKNYLTLLPPISQDYPYSQCCLEREEIMGNNGGCIRLGRKGGSRLEEWRQSRRSQTFIYRRKEKKKKKKKKKGREVTEEERQDRAVSI